MSAPAPAVHPRVVPRGFIRVPTSLIENQAIFTRAEMALALLVLRRASGNENVPVTISDENWKAWTGLGPRLKEYAVAGLRKKCLQVSGRGESARYSFAPSKWESYVRHAERSRPRTLGRKAGVNPKPGARVHPECRERGCAMLQSASGGKLLEFPTLDAQPVAYSCRGDSDIPPPSVYPESGLSSELSTQDAQPVARPDPADETPWPLTLAEVRKYYPLVSPEFICKLHATVQGSFRGSSVSDLELSQAVNVAYIHKASYQKGEGLFLATVPGALNFLRRTPIMTTRRHTSAAVDLLGDHFEQLAGMFETSDPRFHSFGADLRKLRDLPAAKLSDAVAALSDAIEQRVADALDGQQSAEIQESVRRAVLQHGSRMSESQRETLRRDVGRFAALKVFGLPDVGVLV